MLSIFEKEKIRTVSPMTLDDLWKEAETLGRIEVERPSFSATEYKASILFYNRNDSRIYATGRHTDVKQALSTAITEAYSLGARPK